MKQTNVQKKSFRDNATTLQHIQPSAFACQILEQDRAAFSGARGAEFTLSTFLNQLLLNDYHYGKNRDGDYFPGNIDWEIQQLEETAQQDALLRSFKERADFYRKHLGVRRSSDPLAPQTAPKHFRLNKKVVAELFEQELSNLPYTNEVFDGQRGLYIKTVLEEYAKRPPLERETIYFYKQICALRDALPQPLELSLRDGRILFLRPYAIETDPQRQFHYLIGKALPAGSDDTPQNWIISSFRIADIEHVRIHYKRTRQLSFAERNEIAKKLQESGVAFVDDPAEDIAVELTKLGEYLFHTCLPLRPQLQDDADARPEASKTDSRVYCFHCTLRQAEAYFFPFGSEARILSPRKLQERLKERYLAAAAQYSQDTQDTRDTSSPDAGRLPDMNQ